MTKQDILTGFGMVLAAGAGALVFSLQPHIAGTTQEFRVDHNVQPTGVPKPSLPLDKVKLIIQQNNECWIGIPGVTCGPERTYL